MRGVIPLISLKPSRVLRRRGRERHMKPSASSGEVCIVDEQTGGMKGQKPERYDLVPFEALDQIARVYHFGAAKYDDHNWRKGYRWSLSVGACLRHVAKRMQGERLDAESGLPHLAHAGFHILTLLTFDALDLGTNDLPRG